MRSTPTGRRYAPPAPTFIGRRVFRNVDLARDRATTSTGGRSSRRGSWPGRIRRSSTTRSSARRRAACSPTARRCSRDHRGRWLTANGVVGCWPAHRRAATTSCSRPTNRARTPLLDVAQPAPAERAAGAASPITASPTSSRRRHRASRDYVGAFAVTAGLGVDEQRRRSSRRANDDYSARSC